MIVLAALVVAWLIRGAVRGMLVGGARRPPS
jgi:hypothetical protein